MGSLNLCRQRDTTRPSLGNALFSKVFGVCPLPHVNSAWAWIVAEGKLRFRRKRQLSALQYQGERIKTWRLRGI